MKENPIFIVVIILLLLSIGFVQAYGPVLYDLDLIELSVLETNVIPIEEWVHGPLDYSDILKVKFMITNKGVEHYFLHKNMFRIDVFKIIEDERGEDSKKIPTTNYYPQYLENFKHRFQDIELGNNFDDCVFIRHGIPINNSKILTVCFDILRKWEGEALKIDVSKQYYLVLMDSRYSTSCPNCKEILIPTDSEPVVEHAQKITKIPEWVKRVVKFWIADQVDDSSFVQIIEYLVQNEVISIPYAEASEGESVDEIPRWIKKSVEFWVNEKISDDELTTSLEWLINNGIIRG